MDDLGWQRRALCQQIGDDVNFIPDPFLGEPSQPAKYVCAHCPVTAPCRTFRDEHRLPGVWGGEDEADYLYRVGVPELASCACGGILIPTAVGLVCNTCGTVT